MILTERGRFIKTEDVQSEAISKERFKEIMQILRENSEKINELKNCTELRHEIIYGHMRLGTFIASGYARIFPRLSADLQSEAFLSICKAANNIHTVKHEFYTQYITRYIHGALFNFINKQTKHIYIPKDKVISMIKEGISMEKYQNNAVVVDDLQIEDQKESQTHFIDIFEKILKKSNLSSLEHQIILLYVTGHKDSEINNQFNFTRARIGQIRAIAMTKLREAYESDLIAE